MPDDPDAGVTLAVLSEKLDNLIERFDRQFPRCEDHEARLRSLESKVVELGVMANVKMAANAVISMIAAAAAFVLHRP